MEEKRGEVIGQRNEKCIEHVCGEESEIDYFI